MFQLGQDTIYEPKDIDSVLSLLGTIKLSTKAKRGRQKKQCYYELPCAFDIETSSWYEGTQKKACMYCWQLALDTIYIFGRTWGQFKKVMQKITKYLEVDDDNRLVIYVHNLSYEYQFIRKLIKFKEVFNITDRKPIRAITNTGIEFRCSYALSNLSLAKVGEELTKYKVEKKVGDLDYNLIRHSKTPLTDKELGYCINDVKVVVSYIKELMERVGGIVKLPLTRTSFSRKLCSDACLGQGDERKKYHSFIKNLKLDDRAYALLKRCFQGGYVHCSAYYSDVLQRLVGSYDFTSSYPATMVSFDGFPMSSPMFVKPKDKDDFYNYLKYYACAFDVIFYDLKLKENMFVAPLSESKISAGCADITDNGRVVEAKMVGTSLTEQDWKVFEAFYDFSDFKVGSMAVFHRGRLPKPIIDVTLSLYEKKTEYKEVEGKEEEYLVSKGDLNSLYGMMVTDIFKQYDNLEEYNNSFSRFLYYPWGVWISARSRYNLFTGIYEAGEDFIYSDTDSIKMKNYKKHKDYIDTYNKYIVRALDKAMDYYEFDRDRTRPKDKNGVERQLGVWNFEGVYDEFKAIRAKAYFSRKGDKYELTLAGVNKRRGTEYLTSFKKPFKEFNSNMFIPKEYTGKLVHTYIDEETEGTVTDYLGTTTTYKEMSSIHMESAPYDMNAENEYVDMVRLITQGVAVV